MANMAPARYGVVCLLGTCLLLGGCQGFVGAEEESAGTPTVTAVPVPQDEGSGVSSEGVNAARLAETHRQVLSGTNYTLTLQNRLIIDGDPRRVTTRSRRVASGAREYRITRTEQTSNFAPSNYAGVTGYWYNGSSELFRYARETSQRYTAVDKPGRGLLNDPTEHQTIAGMLRAFDTETVTPKRLSNGSYRLRVADLSRSTGIPELGYFVAPRNATLRMTVDRRGYVKSYRVAYAATIAGTDRQVLVIRRLTVSRVGQTQVTPPDWASRVQTVPPAEMER